MRVKSAPRLHAARAQTGELLLHTVSNTRVHGGASRKHDVAVQITTDVEVTLVDRVVAVAASAQAT